jgi:hypothetical protein
MKKESPEDFEFLITDSGNKIYVVPGNKLHAIITLAV